MHAQMQCMHELHGCPAACPARCLPAAGGRHPNGTATPDSTEFNFTLPAGPPAALRIGFVGDPGTRFYGCRLLCLRKPQPCLHTELLANVPLPPTHLHMALMYVQARPTTPRAPLSCLGPASQTSSRFWGIVATPICTTPTKQTAAGSLCPPPLPPPSSCKPGRAVTALAEQGLSGVAMAGGLMPACPSPPTLTPSIPPAGPCRRWDSWARLSQPLLAHVPAIYIGGNHEVV
jgi:hypothetical protein